MTPTPPRADADLLEALVLLCRQAGAAILDIYAGDIQAQTKADASPVTAADERAEALLIAGLARLTPDQPVVAEEQAARGVIPSHGQSFWLVDPLDGTKEFISRNGEFTVNVAWVEAGTPVLGVVLAPALGRCWAGGRGLGAWVEDAQGRRVICCRSVPEEGWTVVGSRSHGDAAAMDAFLGGRTVAAFKPAGSSLKFCLVAEGAADLYPRLGRTMEWDTAAGHAVLLAAGGEVRTLDGAPLRYGKPGLDNPHFFASAA